MHTNEKMMQVMAPVYIVHEGYIAARVVPSQDARILIAYVTVGSWLICTTE